MSRVRLPRVATVLTLALVALLLGGCQAIQGLYPPQAVTDQGQDIRNLYDIVFAIAAVVFLLVEGLIVFAVIRYRRKPADTALPPQIHGNNAIEIVWTVIPTIIVAFLFYVSWQTLNTVDARVADPPIRIRAEAQRFQWSFDYLNADGTKVLFHQLAPDLTVPVGETVQLSLVSPDVIHSFYVPQFLFKRDVVPGRVNAFDFRVDQQGTFRGQCAELCGTFHGAMQFTVTAIPADQFQPWLQQQIAAAPSPSPSGSAPAPSGSAPAPSGSAPAPSGSAPAGGATVEISAQNISFQQQSVTAPANQPFTIKFTNNDAGVPHNVVVHAGPNQSDQAIFDGEIFSGPGERDYNVPALKPGTYLFSCKVHPNMTGTITVQ
jgi:cytochrome c oxidase subunit 2